MSYSISRYKLICSLVLFLVCTTAVLSVYNVNGVGWDFLSHYLNARTVSSSYFYSHLSAFANKVAIHANYGGINHTYYVTPSLVVSKKIYFDDVWEPLPTVLIGILILVFNTFALPIYIIFLIFLLFASSYITAKNLDLDPLLLSSIVAGPFMIKYTILYNGNEILASSFVLLAIGFIMAKDRKSGIFAGLMGLSKYASLFLLPMLLFLRKRKDILYAILLILFVSLPWLVFNYILFGNPIQTYILQLSETQMKNHTIGMFLSAILLVIKYPLIILLIGVVAIIALKAQRKSSRNRSLKTKLKHVSNRNRNKNQVFALIAFFIISLVEFAFVFNKIQGGIRLGYMVYLSVSVMAAVVVSNKSISKLAIKVLKRKYAAKDILPYIIFIITLSLILILYSSWAQIHFNLLGNMGFKSEQYALAVGALKSHNLSMCSVVSNAWPYLNYYNITTYSPYYCNYTMQKMPIVVFKNFGVSNYCSGAAENISQVLKYTNFSIYLPNNYTCIT